MFKTFTSYAQPCLLALVFLNSVIFCMLFSLLYVPEKLELETVLLYIEHDGVFFFIHIVEPFLLALLSLFYSIRFSNKTITAKGAYDGLYVLSFVFLLLAGFNILMVSDPGFIILSLPFLLGAFIMLKVGIRKVSSQDPPVAELERGS